MKKSPVATVMLVTLTVACFAYLVILFLQLFGSADYIALNNATKQVIVAIALAINLVCLLFLWIPSFRDISYLILYAFNRKKFRAYYEQMSQKKLTIDSKVLVLYCYYNEFDAKALKKSIKQSYHNYEFVLLDDSTKPEVRAEIDKVVEELKAKGHRINVVRRDNRKGFKGGAINQYLRTRDDFEYFAVADSDEILCYEFIEQMLKYFQDNSRVAGVQCRHEMRKAYTKFDEYMSVSMRPNMECFFPTRNKYGQITLLGHGMMLSKAAFWSVGGFPELVVEDTALSIRLITAGYQLQYAYNVVCEEAYPVDFVSYKKREMRWTQGDIEIAKNKILKNAILSKDVSIVSKIELLLQFRIGKVLGPFGGFVILVVTILMWALGFSSFKFGLGVMLFGLLSFVALLIAQIIFNIGKESFFKIIVTSAIVVLCCSCLAPAYVGAIIVALCGKKAHFTVTPKHSGVKYTVWDGIRYNWITLLSMAVILAATWCICGNPTPAVVMFLYACASVLITVFSNFRTKEQRLALKKTKVNN